MGTIIIKNISSVSDKTALSLVCDFWESSVRTEELLDYYRVKIKKKGHTFTVVDNQDEESEVSVL